MAPFALRPSQSERRSAQQDERLAPRAGGFMFLDSSLFSRTSAPLGVVQDESEVKDALPTPSPGPSSNASPSSATAPSSSASNLTVNPTLPSNASAIAGACTFFGVVIFMIIGWRYYLWKKKRRSRRRRSKHHGLWSPVSDDGVVDSQPRKLVLKPFIATDPDVKWQPAKISPWLDHRLPRKPPAALSKQSLSISPGSYTDRKGNQVLAENGDVDEKVDERSLLRKASVLQPDISPTSDQSSTILTPNDYLAQQQQQARKKHTRPYTQYTTVSLSQYSPSSTEKSARSNPASPQRGDSLTQAPSAVAGTPSLPLPRLVTVKDNFQVTLIDELEVKVGETLRLVQEFKDGWTLCQRVGPRDAQKGAVPKCCIAERSREEDAPPRSVPINSSSTSEMKLVNAKSTDTSVYGHPLRRTAIAVGADPFQSQVVRV